LSIKQIIDIDCSGCGSKGQVEIWTSINVQLNPEATRKLLDGRINTFHCENCGFNMFIPASLLYHDPLEKFCAQYIPFHWAKDKKFLDSLTYDARLDTDSGLPEDGKPKYFKNIHFVFSMDELARYVFFRHLLARRKLSIERGKLTCFSCRRKIEKGEHHFCVSRLHQVRGDTEKYDDDKVVEATASLQVCTDCMVRAATETIQFVELPLPVLNLEKEGLHRYARLLADRRGELAHAANTSSSCHFCSTAIKSGNNYTQIEVEEEGEDAKCMQVKEKQTIGILCEECAQKYVVWL
jgi:hypothetical protein